MQYNKAVAASEPRVARACPVSLGRAPGKARVRPVAICAGVIGLVLDTNFYAL